MTRFPIQKVYDRMRKMGVEEMTFNKETRWHLGVDIGRELMAWARQFTLSCIYLRIIEGDKQPDLLEVIVEQTWGPRKACCVHICGIGPAAEKSAFELNILAQETSQMLED